MNRQRNADLFDANEIMEALKPLRPDADAFGSAVRRRIEESVQEPRHATRSVSTDMVNAKGTDWLRIAASFAPIHLLSRNFDSGLAPISFAAISIGKKLIFVLAFPVLCFFMIGLTVMGMLNIRASSSRQLSTDFQAEQFQQATRQWWRRYGWIAVIVFTATIFAPFFGWTSPLMIALVCSGFAAVSIVRALAQENLLERGAVGGMCIAGLGLLGQLSNSFSRSSSQVLDTNLVTGVLVVGALIIGSFFRSNLFTSPNQIKSKHQRLFLVLIVSVLVPLGMITFFASKFSIYILPIGIAVALIAAAIALSIWRAKLASWLPAFASLFAAGLVMVVCTQSYWRGVTTETIRQHVETYAGGENGLWEEWADAAKWLNDTSGGYDAREVKKRFQQVVERNPQLRPWMSMSAVRSGLTEESAIRSDADQEQLQSQRMQFVDLPYRDLPILDIKGAYAFIASMASRNDLSPSERAVLAHRLMVNWRQMDSPDMDYDRLKQALLLTELLNRLDPSIEMKRRTEDVHRWLNQHQVTKPLPFRDGGGFYLTQQAPDSDRRATLAAITLMETYGVPSGLDLLQLRAYLRPNFVYDFTPYVYVPKKIAREKLQHLPDAPPMTAMDYLQSDLPLWLAVMLVLLMVYATVCSPSYRPEEGVQQPAT